MKLKYDFEKYHLNKIIELINDKKLELPKFQRGFSWDEEMQKNLIISIMNGNPIGMILLAEMEDSDANALVIIDGQQRLSTIKKYLENPLNYITEDIIEDSIIERMIEEDQRYFNIDDDSKLKLIKHFKGDILCNLIELIEDKINSKIARDYQTHLLLKRGQLLNIAVDISDDLTELLITNISEKLDLKDIIIPTTIYKGNIVELADLFEKVNSGSLPLTKYEILNAKWYNKKIDATDKVEKLVNEVYSSIEKEYSMNEEDFDSYTLFDYCLAVNHELTSDKDFEFFYKKKNIGFELISAILSSFPNEIESLGVIEANMNEEKFNTFIDDLHNAIIDIAATLKKIYDATLYGTKLRKHIFTNTYQQYHVFLSLFFKKYSIEHTIYSGNKVQQSSMFIRGLSNYKVKSKKGGYALLLGEGDTYDIEIKRNSSKDIKGINDTLLLRFMYMLCSDYYSKNRQISDFSHYVSDETSRNIYFTTPSIDDFRTTIHSWMSEQLSNSKFFKKTITKDVKQFAYLYHLLLMKNNAEYSEYVRNYVNFDFDHIFPKASLTTDKAPISCAQNIRLVDSSANRKKSDRTFDQMNTVDQKTNMDFLELFGLTQSDVDNLDRLKSYEEDVKNKEFSNMMKERTEIISKKLETFF